MLCGSSPRTICVGEAGHRVRDQRAEPWRSAQPLLDLSPARFDGVRSRASRVADRGARRRFDAPGMLSRTPATLCAARLSAHHDVAGLHRQVARRRPEKLLNFPASPPYIRRGTRRECPIRLSNEKTPQRQVGECFDAKTMAKAYSERRKFIEAASRARQDTPAGGRMSLAELQSGRLRLKKSQAPRRPSKTDRPGKIDFLESSVATEMTRRYGRARRGRRVREGVLRGVGGR